MFKLGNVPSPSADSLEHADFLEIECLRQSDNNASAADLAAAFGRLSDDVPEDKADSDFVAENTVQEAFSELADRSTHSGCSKHRYPFKVSGDSPLLKLRKDAARDSLYLFLLAATRMNMQSDRVQEGINGAELFEDICCEVAKNYWGTNSEGIVFGTARRTKDDEVGRFHDAVNHLCSAIGEGEKFHNHSKVRPTAQDANLDVVVWKKFSDFRKGKLIGFGQCKTGTHWAKGLFELQPEGFCQKWILTQPLVKPVRLYFIASRVQQTKWFETCVDGGIVFDRCRILDYAPKMQDLKPLWSQWTRTALKSHGIELP